MIVKILNFRKFGEIQRLDAPESLKIAWGPALRARFKINMACRDGFLKTRLEEQYFSPVSGPCWSRFGPIFLVETFHVFGLCSNVCRSF